jgi:hypothetical protein
MSAKLIKDIRPFKPPSTFWYDPAVLQNAALRWLLCLRAHGFKLQGFDHVDFLILETPSAPSPLIVQLAGGLESPSFRLFHCQVLEIPSQSSQLLRLVNKCIYECLRLASDQNPRSIQLLENAFNEIDLAGENFQIEMKNTTGNEFSVRLMIRPSGPYATGGELLIEAKENTSGNVRTRKLLDYCSYWDIKSLLGTVVIQEKVLSITASEDWIEKFPGASSEIVLALGSLFNGEETANVFLSDVADIRKCLTDYDLPW